VLAIVVLLASSAFNWLVARRTIDEQRVLAAEEHERRSAHEREMWRLAEARAVYQRLVEAVRDVVAGVVVARSARDRAPFDKAMDRFNDLFTEVHLVGTPQVQHLVETFWADAVRAVDDDSAVALLAEQRVTLLKACRSDLGLVPGDSPRERVTGALSSAA
jgi:alpha-ketoglutarate-dependent taurine dioxygenase